MKRIWFVSHYSMPPKYEMRIKTQMYAHYLQQMGYECTIFSASTIHNTSINLIEDKSKYIKRTYDDLDFVHIRVSNYTGNGIKRIMNMRQFAKRFKKIATKDFEKPDVIVADVNCLNYYPIYKYAKKNRIPFYTDIRDLWPLSIVEYYKLSAKNPIIKWMFHKEKKMYSRATKNIFSMEGAYDYIAEKGWNKSLPREKICYINNGVDLESFDKNVKECIIKDDDLLNKSTFKVIYAGSIRLVNNIGLLLDAFKLLPENVVLLVWGDGNERKNLEKRLGDEGIKNVKFKGSVEKKYIPFITSNANLNIVHFSTTFILKYGISGNKLFDYCAAEKPVLCDVKPNYNPILQYNAGTVTVDQTPEEIAKSIMYFYKLNKSDYAEYCANARKLAEDFDYKVLTKKLLSVIKE